MVHVAERQFWAACVATKTKISSHVQTQKTKNSGDSRYDRSLSGYTNQHPKKMSDDAHTLMLMLAIAFCISW